MASFGVIMYFVVLFLNNFTCSCKFSQKDDKKDSGDKKEDKKDDAKSKEAKAKDLTSMQAVAALSVAVIAMGEEVGSEMTTRIFGQLVSI